MTAYTLPRIRQPEAVERDERLDPARGIIAGVVLSVPIWIVVAIVVGAAT